MKETVWFLLLSNGRLNRKGYWLFFGPLILVAFYYKMMGMGPIIVNIFTMALLIFITFSIVIKRLHDINKPGLWSLIIFVPIIGGLALIALGFIKGTDGENTYGNYKFLSEQ